MVIITDKEKPADKQPVSVRPFERSSMDNCRSRAWTHLLEQVSGVEPPPLIIEKPTFPSVRTWACYPWHYTCMTTAKNSMMDS